MTDDEALEHWPVLREFVDAVNARDQAFVQQCFKHTHAYVFAVLAAGWVGDLLDRVEALEFRIVEAEGRRVSEVEAARAGVRDARGDALESRAEVARLRGKVAELREILNARTAAAPGRRAA